MLKIKITETIKKLINNESFMKEHRTNPSFFTRERKLTFPMLVIILLQKSVKSLQLLLNEVMDKLDPGLVTVTDSAFTQARRKLLHTAFTELNEKAIVGPYYENGDYETWRGFRLIAIDGSKVMLPDEKDIRDFFGVIRTANQVKDYKGSYPCGLVSVAYMFWLQSCNHINISLKKYNFFLSKKQLKLPYIPKLKHWVLRPKGEAIKY